MSPQPDVSVVIPTCERPTLLARAVGCALNQTLRSIEVIVVVDGRDQPSRDVLAAIDDPRLRELVPPRRLGNAGARNAGVEMARGRWVAFLDDDDLWMESKLELQLRVARQSIHRYPIVACHLVARSETQDFLWPRRRPRVNEALCEYLFCRSTPYTGEGLIVTSVIFAPRELLLRVRFRDDLPRYVDPDWLLRADLVEGSGVEFVPDDEPLAVWHIERGRSRITNSKDWRFSLEYARRNRHLFTKRAYAAFILHIVSHTAAAQHAWRAWLPLVFESLRGGRPAPVDLMSHAGNFLLPDEMRRGAAERFARRRGAAVRGAPES
jgi:glycosyltransferase involved in cell wall biosynthesis